MTDTIDLSNARWFKSSRSAGKQECVEAAHVSGGRVAVRDSKNPTGPALVFTPSEWDAFTTGVLDGEFDRPSA
ncbi:DUF397 domain-containing protein [Nocardia sp. BMG51109]|uniref:DUF397 domain-containing protein n=1 Tax=Nocardia sp. BMG51109 TaxID=1056816 RepID=UPI000463D50B|nr:DUF397 domain-containing protein [Nocardia sp. BMG51109]